MQKRKGILIGVIILAIMISTVIVIRNQEQQQNEQMPNPASVYCIEHEGNLNLVTLKDGSQYGICTFSDNSSCEEWAFYRGECIKGSKTGCASDEECVADSCCHSTGCTAKTSAPECSRVLCSQECVPGTLDCGQGSCKCINGVCGASLNG